MENKGRAQCLVTRNNKILMAKHRQYGIEYNSSQLEIPNYHDL